jgi:hypothetical protein
MIQLEWLMDQIDLYCAQGAEEVAAEEDSTMTYKEAYRDYLELMLLMMLLGMLSMLIKLN